MPDARHIPNVKIFAIGRNAMPGARRGGKAGNEEYSSRNTKGNLPNEGCASIEEFLKQFHSGAVAY
jgi:hypothetical protein